MSSFCIIWSREQTEPDALVPSLNLALQRLVELQYDSKQLATTLHIFSDIVDVFMPMPNFAAMAASLSL